MSNKARTARCCARIGRPALLFWDTVMKKGTRVSWDVTRKEMSVHWSSNKCRFAEFTAWEIEFWGAPSVRFPAENLRTDYRLSNTARAMIFASVRARLHNHGPPAVANVTCPSKQLFVFPRPRSQKFPGSRVLTFICLFRVCTSIEFHSVHSVHPVDGFGKAWSNVFIEEWTFHKLRMWAMQKNPLGMPGWHIRSSRME